LEKSAEIHSTLIIAIEICRCAVDKLIKNLGKKSTMDVKTQGEENKTTGGSWHHK